MKLLGLDLEIGNPFEDENGDSTPDEKTWITEIGLVLYDTKFGTQPVMSYESLVNEGKGVSEDAAEYTGITTELIESYGADPKTVAETTLMMMKEADYIVAHNGEKADKGWLRQFLGRYLDKESFKDWNPPKWIDSMTDIEYPKNCFQRSLTYLQAFHGFANPFPHRAGSDVLTMMKIFFQYDPDRIIKISESPKVTLKAFSPLDRGNMNRKNAFTEGTKEYQEMERWKKKVKKAGFRWIPGEKSWKKETRQILIEEGLGDYDFDFEKVSNKS